jgi:hypothetical protein
MLGTGQVQNGVIDRNEKVIALTLKLASERALVEVFDDIFADEPPELARGDPHTPFEADYLRRMPTGHTNTPKLP